MKKVALVTVSGLPGSGKSTLCERLCRLRTNDCFIVWIEYDRLIPIQIFSESCDNNEWKNWRQAILGCSEKLLASWKSIDFVRVLNEDEKAIWLNMSTYCSLNTQNIIVLLDDNFYYSSMRRPFYSLAKKYSCSYVSLVCSCEVDVCILRNRSRSSPVREDIIQKMAEKFEWPDPVNNSWEKHRFLVNSCTDDTNYPASLLNSLKLALNYPVINDDFMKDEERHKNRIINLENLHHNADNHLRKVANQMIKSNDSSRRAVFAKMILDVKAETLQVLHEVLSKGNPTWTVESFQQFAESLFQEKLSEAFNNGIQAD
ncbi:unnamed protein product [Heterobilharzia americana]|nr:unnamed protein product [Heterobilharzia americana]